MFTDLYILRTYDVRSVGVRCTNSWAILQAVVVGRKMASLSTTSSLVGEDETSSDETVDAIGGGGTKAREDDEASNDGRLDVAIELGLANGKAKELRPLTGV